MALRELFAEFGVNFDTDALEEGDSAVGNLASGLKALGAALAGAAVVAGLRNLVEDVRQMGDELDKTGIQLGISTQDMQEWQFAAGLAGVEASAFSQSLALLQRNANEAAEGTGAQAEAFARLGVSVVDANGELKDGNTLLTETGVALGALTNDSERVALSLELMGRSGRRMLPLFSQGAEGIARARAELEQLGGGLSQEVIDQSVALTDEQLRLETAFTSLKSTIALAVLPTLNTIVHGFVTLASGIARVTKGTHVAQIVMGTLGVAALALGAKMLFAFAIPIAMAAAVVIAIGFVVLVVDDLITLFGGGESVIGEFVDALFGVGTTKSVIQDLTDAWDGLTLSIKQAAAALGIIDDFDDGIANTSQTAQEADEASIRRAALAGGFVRTAKDRAGGLTQEDALARSNQIRQGEGLGELFFNEQGALGERPSEGRSQSRQAARQLGQEQQRGEVRRRSQSGTVEQNVQQGDINISVNADGQNAQEISEQIRRTIREQQGVNLRDTIDALRQEVDGEGEE